MIVIVMGVTGCGKSTTGKLLAQRMGSRFVDADDFHPPANIEKMQQGIALTDADRTPWLTALNVLLHEAVVTDASCVLACSALRVRYREQLAQAIPPDALRWVYLEADEMLIEKRLANRPGHFMSPTLVASQFETLEPPTDAIMVNASQPAEQIVLQIFEQLAM